MSLTSAQLTSLRAKCFADPTAAAFFVAPGNASGLQNYLNGNATPDFNVFRKMVQTAEIGLAIHYTALSSLTTADRDRLTTFYTLNPISFDPSRADMTGYLDTTFAGALGGFGATTRDNLQKLWRALAKVAEKMLASTTAGNGAFATPAMLTFQGDVNSTEATTLIYKDDGSIWTPAGR